MTTDHIYTLEIHIDSRCITKQSLIENIKSFLREYLNKIAWEVDSDASLYHQLTIIGDIVSIDCCHNLIQQIINNKELRYYRVMDEMGDEIRKRAYPILAEIEQRFRAFINKVLVEVLGFDWWAKYTLKEIPESVKQRYNDYKNNQVSPSFLECSDFNHLVNIIRAKVSELPSNKSITKENVDSILENCNTLEEVKALWNEKTKVISLWDTFSRYFEDTHAWENLAKELDQEVIDARNKVMHHRPIRFYVIEKLKEVKQRLIEIFNSASFELTEEVRIEVQQETETILRSQELRQHFNSSLDFSINHFDELITGTRNAIKSPFDKPLVSGRSSSEKMFDELITGTRNATKSPFDKPIVSGRSSSEKMFDELITGTKNAFKSPLDEYESIMGTNDAFKSALAEYESIMGTKNAFKSALAGYESIMGTNDAFKSALAEYESIMGTKNAFKSPLDEYESIMGTKNAFKSPLDEFITGSKSSRNRIQNSLNESITSAKMRFSKEINENIFPSGCIPVRNEHKYLKEESD
jgi:hypothetical protein